MMKKRATLCMLVITFLLHGENREKEINKIPSLTELISVIEMEIKNIEKGMSSSKEDLSQTILSPAKEGSILDSLRWFCYTQKKVIELVKNINNYSTMINSRTKYIERAISMLKRSLGIYKYSIKMLAKDVDDEDINMVLAHVKMQTEELIDECDKVCSNQHHFGDRFNVISKKLENISENTRFAALKTLLFLGISLISPFVYQWVNSNF